jgi:hypothetical protein
VNESQGSPFPCAIPSVDETYPQAASATRVTTYPRISPVFRAIGQW